MAIIDIKEVKSNADQAIVAAEAIIEGVTKDPTLYIRDLIDKWCEKYTNSRIFGGPSGYFDEVDFIAEDYLKDKFNDGLKSPSTQDLEAEFTSINSGLIWLKSVCSIASFSLYEDFLNEAERSNLLTSALRFQDAMRGIFLGFTRLANSMRHIKQGAMPLPTLGPDEEYKDTLFGKVVVKKDTTQLDRIEKKLDLIISELTADKQPG